MDNEMQPSSFHKPSFSILVLQCNKRTIIDGGNCNLWLGQKSLRRRQFENCHFTYLKWSSLDKHNPLLVTIKKKKQLLRLKEKEKENGSNSLSRKIFSLHYELQNPSSKKYPENRRRFENEMITEPGAKKKKDTIISLYSIGRIQGL